MSRPPVPPARTATPRRRRGSRPCRAARAHGAHTDGLTRCGSGCVRSVLKGPREGRVLRAVPVPPSRRARPALLSPPVNARATRAATPSSGAGPRPCRFQRRPRRGRGVERNKCGGADKAEGAPARQWRRGQQPCVRPYRPRGRCQRPAGFEGLPVPGCWRPPARRSYRRSYGAAARTAGGTPIRGGGLPGARGTGGRSARRWGPAGAKGAGTVGVGTGRPRQSGRDLE
jgi:hypothetical protein